jgi:quercetin dioxygenase-like cupin family protein
MTFQEQQVKGLARLLTDIDLPAERLRIHISEVGPGERSHPPHQHPGVEAFYMLAGEGTLEIEAERQRIAVGEAIVFDPTKLHGLVNSGDVPMRYIVIIAREG